jgi:uncharacterized membrane protein YdjX (TVP38/TMEM64 family)
VARPFAEELMSEIGASGSSRLAKLIAGSVLLAAVALVIWVWAQGDVQWSREVIAEHIASYGALSRAVYVAVMVLRPFLLTPFWVMVAVGGALFGIEEGILLATLGATLHGVFFFVTARILGRDIVARHVGGRAGAIINALGERGARYLAGLLPIPGMPLSATFAAAGLSSMRFAHFLVAIVVGLFPRTVLYSFGGESFAEGHWVRLGFVAIVALVVTGFALRYRKTIFSAQPLS